MCLDRAGFDRGRRRPPGFGRRLEDGEIAYLSGERFEPDLLVSCCGELAAQQVPRRSVLPRWPIKVHDANARAGPQRRHEVVEEREGLLDFVVHVDQDRGIGGGPRQSRIVRLAENRRYVVQALGPQTLLEIGEVRRSHILRIDPAVRPERSGEPHGMISAARAKIGDDLAGLETETPDNLTRLVDGVALLLGGPDGADDLGDGTAGSGERACRRAGRGRWPALRLRLRHPEEREHGNGRQQRKSSHRHRSPGGFGRVFGGKAPRSYIKESVALAVKDVLLDGFVLLRP